jgi:ssDNA-binding replication factor A large subunit
MNREFKARIKNMRDALAEMSVEMTEMLGDFKEVEEEQEEDVNWTTAKIQDIEGPFIKDLKENMSLKDIAITGQIKSVGELKGYVKKSGEKGLVYNIQLEDPTGTILCVFWDEQTEKAKEFTVGQFIRITDAWQIKSNKFGKLELHPGKFAKLELVE